LKRCWICFGGLCALDLARKLRRDSWRGEFSRSAETFRTHGTESARQGTHAAWLRRSDGSPEDVLAVAKEFTAADADWQLHAYRQTVHAFMNPKAQSRAGGMQYDEAADRRSWHALEEFLAEVLK